MSLSGNNNVPEKQPVRMTKKCGHSGTVVDRQGNDFINNRSGFRLPTQAYRDNYEGIFGKKD